MHQPCGLPAVHNYTTSRTSTDLLCLLLVSRWDRLLLFGGLILGALVMFVIAFALIPTGVFVLKPRKFVVL